MYIHCSMRARAASIFPVAHSNSTSRIKVPLDWRACINQSLTKTTHSPNSITTIAPTAALVNSNQPHLRSEIHSSLTRITWANRVPSNPTIIQSLTSVANRKPSFHWSPKPSLSAATVRHFHHSLTYQLTHSRTVTNPATISLNLPTTQTLPETSCFYASPGLLPEVAASFKATQRGLALSGASYWSHLMARQTHFICTTISYIYQVCPINYRVLFLLSTLRCWSVFHPNKVLVERPPAATGRS